MINKTEVEMDQASRHFWKLLPTGHVWQFGTEKKQMLWMLVFSIMATCLGSLSLVMSKCRLERGIVLNIL